MESICNTAHYKDRLLDASIKHILFHYYNQFSNYQI